MNAAHREWRGLSDPGHRGYNISNGSAGRGGRGVNTQNNNIQSRGRHT